MQGHSHRTSDVPPYLHEEKSAFKRSMRMCMRLIYNYLHVRMCACGYGAACARHRIPDRLLGSYMERMQKHLLFILCIFKFSTRCIGDHKLVSELLESRWW